MGTGNAITERFRTIETRSEIRCWVFWPEIVWQRWGINGKRCCEDRGTRANGPEGRERISERMWVLLKEIGCANALPILDALHAIFIHEMRLSSLLSS